MLPRKPDPGRREERPQCWSRAPQGTPANTLALRPDSTTTCQLTTSLMAFFSMRDRRPGAQHPHQFECNNLILFSFPSIYGE